MNKKEELLKELHDVNYKYFKEVMGEESLEDSIGMDKDHLFRALRYVPNTEIKKWIKELKKDIKDVQSDTKRKVQGKKDRSKHSD